ncbi:MAG: hypothetical protein Q7U20_00240 [Caulobacter sp.]|nr:hypothetical protein [Caulobacter sp.]
MILMPLMLAGAVAFGHGAAVDQRPFAASRTDAIRAAAKVETVEAPAPEDTDVRYPSADGDILADMSPRTAVPPLTPARPIAARVPPATTGPAVDATGLLGGPRY